MLMRSVVLVVLLAILGGINASAVTDSRPDGITGATWQFGPLNRWAYTHIREILPTKNIAIALGERIIDTKTDKAPAKRTHKETSAKSSNARFTAPPKTIAITPVTLSITLQNPAELKEDIIMLLYDSSL